jgi:hypothetical protein
MAVGVNNPLNIRRTTTRWLGEDMTATGAYCAFTSAEYCYRAGAKILKAYEARGIHTLQDAITTWAPESDGNPTAAYIKNVSAWTGINPDTVTELATLPILRAMTRQETGGSVPDSVIELGLTLANPQPES